MRSITSLFLTALILLNLFGFYAVFMVQQQEIRRDMDASLNEGHKADNQIFNFSKTQYAQLNWTVGGKEFIMNGHMYDVKGIKQTCDNVELAVANDTGETELVSSFLSFFSQQQDKDQNSSPLKTFISHFQQDYVATGLWVPHLASASVNCGFMVKQAFPSPSFVADNLTPPPQFFLV